jgi:Na+/melibiose symporter-like transporter
MENRNPYLSCIILWISAVCVALLFSIYGIVSGNLFLAISQLVLIVFDSIYLGWCIRRFNEFRELEKMKESLKEFIDNMDKIKENEPFKEFENNGESSSRKV